MLLNMLHSQEMATQEIGENSNVPKDIMQEKTMLKHNWFKTIMDSFHWSRFQKIDRDYLRIHSNEEIKKMDN